MKKAESEGREMTEDEVEQYNKDIARAEEITKQIEDQAARSARIADLQKRAADIRAKVVNPISGSGTFDDGQNLKDLRRFSLGKALRSIAGHKPIDGVEREVIEEGAKEARDAKVSFDTRAVILPASALRAMNKRATTVTSTSGGTVPAEVYDSIFEMYRSRQVLSKLGATIFEGLSGDLKLNTQTAAGGTLAVAAETAAATSLDPTINTITLSPNRIAAYTQISNQLILQSTPDVESFAVNNLVKSIMDQFQSAIFTGAKSTAIEGIPNVTGVNVQNVATANQPTWAEILGMVGTLPGTDFDIQRSGFVLNSTVMATLMSTLKSPNNFEFIMSEFFNADGLKSLSGLKAAITNSVGSNIIFGAWEQLFVGMWGGIGLIYDPYTQAVNGSVQVVAESFLDGQLGNPALFTSLSMATA